MKYISSKDLRECWKDFWLSKNHKYLDEASLIGGKESTAMFNIAGMQQLIPYLSGKEHPLGKRLFNIQKCIRTVDIDDVGDASHLTFFEMMGNRSLGDYFKKDAIDRSREFLVDVLGFDKEKLAATVFVGDEDAPRDEESAGYRKKYLPEHRIAYLPADNNRRSPGPIGPCGPDTEIFYRVGESEFPPVDSNPGTDEKNWLEIWNNVFMEFYRGEDGKLTKLANQNVDTGMGYERMCKVLQGAQTVYETDILYPLIQIVEEDTKKSYTGNERNFRIIVDHFRAAAHLIAQGVIPSNVGPGYVLRKIIRRMYYKLFGDWKDYQFSPTSLVKKLYSESKIDALHADVFYKEIDLFQKTVSKGRSKLFEIMGRLENKTLSGEDAFLLFDTYGIPLEITKEECLVNGFIVDEEGFEKEMEKQRERSRLGSKDMFKQGIDWATYLQGVAPTFFVGYDTLDTTQTTLLKDFEVQGQRILVFDRTSFYAESGGQVGDTGQIVLDSGEILTVTSVQKYNGIFLHFVV